MSMLQPTQTNQKIISITKQSAATQRPAPPQKQWDRAAIRRAIQITDPGGLYNIYQRMWSADGLTYEDIRVEFESVNGAILFNHYRHNVTNYDAVLKDIGRNYPDGRATDEQAKYADAAAAEVVLEFFRDEHSKVIKNAQANKIILKDITDAAGTVSISKIINRLQSTAEAVYDVTIGKLNNSRQSFQNANNALRCKETLTLELLKQRDISAEVIADVERLQKQTGIHKIAETWESITGEDAAETEARLEKAKRITKLKTIA